MPDAALLALRFQPDLLRADLARLLTAKWTPHFNKNYFEGDWSGIPLRAAPQIRGLSTGHANDPSIFAPTEALQACPYFQEVLAGFDCPLKSVRLLRLAAGSIIREHTDSDLGEQLESVRVHIPVITNPQVEFYLAGKRVVMNAGECWYLDLSLLHRVQNRGATDRVHLVIDCVLNDWLRNLIHKPLPAPASREDYVTGAAAFARFTDVVFDDAELQSALYDICDLEEFLRQAVQCGGEHGFQFTTEDVRAAWTNGRSAPARFA